MFFLQSEFKKKVWYTLGHTTLFLFMRKSTAATIEGASERRRRVASAEAHEKVSTPARTEAGGVQDLAADIFGDFDREVRASAAAVESVEEDAGQDADARSQRARQVGEALKMLDTAPQTALGTARVLIEQGWVDLATLPQDAQTALAALEQLHEQMESRQQAFAAAGVDKVQRNAKIRELHTRFYSHPEVVRLSEQVVNGFKRVGVDAYHTEAARLQDIADAAFLKSEQAERLLDEYPELGGVFDAKEDTLEVAQEVYRRRLLPKIGDIRMFDRSSHMEDASFRVSRQYAQLPEWKRDIDAIDTALAKAPVGVDESNTQLDGPYIPEMSFPSVQNYRTKREELSAKVEKVERYLQMRFFIAERTAERILAELEAFPEEERRAVLEYQKEIVVTRIKRKDADHSSPQFHEALTVYLTEANRAEDYVPLIAKMPGVHIVAQRMLLRELSRKRTLELLEDGMVVNPWLVEQSDSSTALRVSPVRVLRDYLLLLKAPVEASDADGYLQFREGGTVPNGFFQSIDRLSVPQLISEIQKLDPDFYTDLAVVADRNKAEVPWQQQRRTLYQDMFPHRAASGLPYGDSKQRDLHARRFQEFTKRASAWTTEHMVQESAGGFDRTSIFTAEQGVREIERIQIAALRALAEKDASAGAPRERAVIESEQLDQLQRKIGALMEQLGTAQRSSRVVESSREVYSQREAEAKKLVSDLQRKVEQLAEQHEAQKIALEQKIKSLQEREEKTNKDTIEPMRKLWRELHELLSGAEARPGLMGGNATDAISKALDKMKSATIR